MNKSDLLNKYPNAEDKLLISKVLDKIKFCETRNKITNTNFLDARQQNIVTNLLSSIKFVNYVRYGGFDNAERACFIFYPDKFEQEFVFKNIDNILKVIHIKLPKELHNTYLHKNYLSGIIKLGIEREKIGDIIVQPDGAYILACADFVDTVSNLLASLTRFSKATIEIIPTEQLPDYEIKKEEIKIIIPSMRLDTIVSELAHTSRSKAINFLNSERVLVNYETETKASKLLNPGDIVTIRGKGKFELCNIAGNTKSGNVILLVNKYV